MSIQQVRKILHTTKTLLMDKQDALKSESKNLQFLRKTLSDFSIIKIDFSTKNDPKSTIFSDMGTQQVEKIVARQE